MIRIRRILAFLLIVSLLGSAIGSGAALAQSQAVFLSVQTSTTPEQPTSGEEFDLHVTVSSADAGTNNAYISRISLVNATTGEKERYATDYSIGQVSPGFSLGHAMDVELDEEGVYDLYLEMTVRAAGRQFRVYEPVRIEIYDGHPLVDVNAADAIAGTTTNLSVTLANGLDEPVRNVELTLDSESVEIQQPRRVASSVETGQSKAFSFKARSASAGDQEIAATIRYTNGSGDRRYITRMVTATFAEPEHADDVRVAAEVAPTLSGSQTTLNVTVSNGLEIALRQLELSLAGDGVMIPQPDRVDGRIESGEKRTYTFRVTKPESGPQPVTVQLTYITQDGTTRTIERTLDTSFTEPQNPGEVTLTGIDVERDGDTLMVSGTASNIGGSEVAAVTVGVEQGTDVAPGRSQSEFFVGSIPESDFVSFDVNARLVGNTTSAEIPLVLTYTVDDVRRQKTIAVQYEADSSGTQQPNDGGLPIIPLMGAGVLLIVIVAAIIYWRQR